MSEGCGGQQGILHNPEMSIIHMHSGSGGHTQAAMWSLLVWADNSTYPLSCKTG